MRKESGFTLVEVLTTITIIGLLLLIAVPSITKVIEKSRTDAFESQQAFLLEAGEDYFTEKILKNPDSITWLTKNIMGFDLEYAVVSLDVLIENGNIKSIYDPSDKTECSTTSSYVEVRKHSDTKYTYSVALSCANYSADETISGSMTCHEFSIDSSLVGSDLSHFPITLNLNNGNGTDEIFTEIGNSYQKMKTLFTDATDTIKEMYVEVESWDKDAGVGGEATLHTSHPDFVVSSSVDTVISLCYDASFSDNVAFVGNVGSSVGANVWNSDYLMVYHMTDTVVDSTTNNNDPASDTTTVTTGLNGSAKEFGSGKFITVSNDGMGTFDLQNYTLMFLYKVPTVTTGHIFWSYDYTSHVLPYYSQHVRINDDSSVYYYHKLPTVLHYPVTVANNTWYVLTTALTSGSQIVLQNDTIIGTGTGTGTVPYYNQEVWLGYSNWGAGTTATMDEVRISSVKRSNDWIVAEYENLNGNLVIY